MITLERPQATSIVDDPSAGSKDSRSGTGRSDATLVADLVRRDEAALAEIHARHSNAVLALARRLVHDRTLAEEITQEVFLRLWNRPERFDPDRGSVRAFLLADTHGRSIDLLRSELARRDREEREAQRTPSVPPSVEGEVLSLVTSEAVRTAVSTLGDEERQAIELAYFGGLTYREVAGRLGEPEGTVKSRIRTAMRRLRVDLQAAGVGA